MSLSKISMKACPFCGSLDVDAQFSASQKDEGGPIEHSPGCMDCGATAETVEIWNTRKDSGESVMVEYRGDLLPDLKPRHIHPCGFCSVIECDGDCPQSTLAS